MHLAAALDRSRARSLEPVAVEPADRDGDRPFLDRPVGLGEELLDAGRDLVAELLEVIAVDLDRDAKLPTVTRFTPVSSGPTDTEAVLLGASAMNSASSSLQPSGYSKECVSSSTLFGPLSPPPLSPPPHAERTTSATNAATPSTVRRLPATTARLALPATALVAALEVARRACHEKLLALSV